MKKISIMIPTYNEEENVELFFDTEEEMREYIESQSKGIRVEAMFKLTKIKW